MKKIILVLSLGAFHKNQFGHTKQWKLVQNICQRYNIIRHIFDLKYFFPLQPGPRILFMSISFPTTTYQGIQTGIYCDQKIDGYPTKTCSIHLHEVDNPPGLSTGTYVHHNIFICNVLMKILVQNRCKWKMDQKYSGGEISDSSSNIPILPKPTKRKTSPPGKNSITFMNQKSFLKQHTITQWYTKK